MTREEVEGLVGELRKPSQDQTSRWHDAKAVYATKPRKLLDAAASALEALLQEQDRGLSREPSPSTEKATPKSAATEAER